MLEIRRNSETGQMTFHMVEPFHTVDGRRVEWVSMSALRSMTETMELVHLCSHFGLIPGLVDPQRHLIGLVDPLESAKQEAVEFGTVNVNAALIVVHVPASIVEGAIGWGSWEMLGQALQRAGYKGEIVGLVPGMRVEALPDDEARVVYESLKRRFEGGGAH